VNYAPISNVVSSLASFTLPMPSDSFRYASGGQVVANSGTSVLEAILSGINSLNSKLPVAIQIIVDPLSSNPVKVSEIAEQGAIMRSSF